jgi:hypothetical protein
MLLQEPARFSLLELRLELPLLLELVHQLASVAAAAFFGCGFLRRGCFLYSWFGCSRAAAGLQLVWLLAWQQLS